MQGKLVFVILRLTFGASFPAASHRLGPSSPWEWKKGNRMEKKGQMALVLESPGYLIVY